MTEAEFKTFSKRLFGSFPALWGWLHDTSPVVEDTLAAWRMSLDGCTIEECNRVVDRWLTGILKPFEAYERERVAIIIRSHVMFIRSAMSRTRIVDAPDEIRLPTDLLGEFDLMAAIAVLERMERDGATEDAREKRLAELFPPEPDDLARRYACLDCHDTGWINIWHPHAVQAVRRKRKRLSDASANCAVACICAIGSRYSGGDREEDGFRSHRGSYDPLQHCAIPRGATNARAQRILGQWIVEQDTPKRHTELTFN